jgi:hypothetical protein
MKACWIPVALLALLAPEGAAAVPLPKHWDRDVLIARVTPDPGATSGVLALAVGVEGIVGGRARSYFIPFMSIGQRKPHPGQLCALRWQWAPPDFQWHLGDGRSIRSGREIGRFGCRRPRDKAAPN